MTDLPPLASGATPAPPMPLEAVFTRAWSLLRANAVVALPPVILVALCVVLAIPFIVTIWSSALAPGGHVVGSREPPPWWALASLAAAYALLLGGGFSAIVMMFGMADSAWARGSTGFADGLATWRARSGALFAASVGLFGVSVVALILALPTLGLSMLAFIVFTIYVLPAAIGGGRSGFAAIADSFRLVRAFFVRSAIGIALLMAAYYVISFAGYFAVFPIMVWFMKAASEPSHVATLPLPTAPLPLPPVPLIVACGALYLLIAFISLAYYGYYALVLVGMYRSLVGPGDAADPGAGVASAAPSG